MALVTFVLGFKTGELRSLDLPIEVRKHDSTIVARTLASQAVDVRPGHYYASARLPGGQRLLQPFEMGDQPQTVTLVPDPEDESAHEWEETSHYLQTPRSDRQRAGGGGFIRRQGPRAPRVRCAADGHRKGQVSPVRR